MKKKLNFLFSNFFSSFFSLYYKYDRKLRGVIVEIRKKKSEPWRTAR